MSTYEIGDLVQVIDDDELLGRHELYLGHTFEVINIEGSGATGDGYMYLVFDLDFNDDPDYYYDEGYSEEAWVHVGNSQLLSSSRQEPEPVKPKGFAKWIKGVENAA